MAPGLSPRGRQLFPDKVALCQGNSCFHKIGNFSRPRERPWSESESEEDAVTISDTADLGFVITRVLFTNVTRTGLFCCLTDEVSVCTYGINAYYCYCNPLVKRHKSSSVPGPDEMLATLLSYQGLALLPKL